MSQGVYERVKGSNVWWVRIPTGEQNRYRREKAGTYEEACAIYRREVIDQRAMTSGKGPTLLEAMERFLSFRNDRPDSAYHSHARYFNAVFPGATLAYMAQLDTLKTWRAAHLEEKSPATVAHKMAFLSGVFWQAVEDGHLHEHPIGKGVRKVRFPRPGPGRVRWLTEDEEELLKSIITARDQLMQARKAAGLPTTSDTHYWEVVRFNVLTGIRRGEQAALEWTCIRENYMEIEKSKNGKARILPLHPEALEILNARRERGLPKPFPCTTPQCLSKPLDRLVKQAGLKGVSFHILRHTAATRAAMGGVSMAKLGAYLGHSSLAITQKYAHLDPDSLADVVRVIGGAPPPPPVPTPTNLPLVLAPPPPVPTPTNLPLVLAPPPPPRQGGLRLLG